VFGELVVVDSVAAEFAERVIEAFLARPSEFFSLVLSGGSTARTCYEGLADAGGAQIDWWRVDVYWGDERCVPLDHEDSNYRLGREALLENVGAVNANYPMRCEDGPDRYHQLVGQLGQFDVLHLGLGADGHTASLFPDSPGLDADPGRLVVMNEDPTGANPHPRETLTFSGIERARLALVTVSGEEKAEALARTVAGETPASRIRAEQVVWLVDKPAASLLS
jgi:6-phosphogluconolactonase